MLNVPALLAARLRSLRNQRLSRQEFEQRRLQRFRSFAAFVRNRSPYYRRVMLERGIEPSSCTPADFPPLTKREVAENFDQIVTAPDVSLSAIREFLHESHEPTVLFRNRYVVVHTSGSSGEVGYFVYDLSDLSRALAQLSHSSARSMFSMRRKRIAFFGATEGHFTGVSIILATRMAPMNLQYSARLFEVSRPLAETVAGLNAWQPDMLLGYATCLKALAEKKLEGELRIAPASVHNSAEPLLEGDRKLLEKAFGPCISNFYVCSEHLYMAMREPTWNSMRLLEDDLIFEIFPDHTLVTNLFNRTFPLIRYRMNDTLTPLLTDEHTPYHAIAEVVGRVEQLAKFVNRDGQTDSLSPSLIGELLIPHVRRLQMRLRSPESFTLAVVLDPFIADHQRANAFQVAESKLRAILDKKELQNVTFNVLAVDDLPVDSKTGKFRLIVDNSGTT